MEEEEEDYRQGMVINGLTDGKDQSERDGAQDRRSRRSPEGGENNAGTMDRRMYIWWEIVPGLAKENGWRGTVREILRRHLGLYPGRQVPPDEEMEEGS
jgi:hypothetical protein